MVHVEQNEMSRAQFATQILWRGWNDLGLGRLSRHHRCYFVLGKLSQTSTILTCIYKLCNGNHWSPRFTRKCLLISMMDWLAQKGFCDCFRESWRRRWFCHTERIWIDYFLPGLNVTPLNRFLILFSCPFQRPQVSHSTLGAAFTT